MLKNKYGSVKNESFLTSSASKNSDLDEKGRGLKGLYPTIWSSMSEELDKCIYPCNSIHTLSTLASLDALYKVIFIEPKLQRTPEPDTINNDLCTSNFIS